MGTPMSIHGCRLTPLRIIPGAQGDVLHAMKCTDEGFTGFGEAYFSSVKTGEVKGWRRHHRMTLNLVVAVGKIRFQLRDERSESSTKGQSAEAILSPDDNYQRLTVPPGVWLCFEGIAEGLNLLLNLADLPHDPTEVEVAA
jgi:dTDP-4-dehydrorhamnose 3,5-epimerase